MTLALIIAGYACGLFFVLCLAAAAAWGDEQYDREDR